MSLIYVTDTEPGYLRRKSGKGFSYHHTTGERLTDKQELARIKALGIPPAYTAVWVCMHSNGHIQATGRDAKGRKQYRYHADWTAAQDNTKYAHMLTFAKHLPRIRRHVRTQMHQPGLGRSKVIATAINLLESTLIRVGNEDYARTNKSYGLTTLRTRHVKIVKGELRFKFMGKSGKEWNLRLTDPRIAKVLRACQELPGQRLFQYLDDDGERHSLSSQDINEYLRTLTGEDITAKDFRTWAGTVQTFTHLSVLEAPTSPTAFKRTVSEVIKRVATSLGNTPAICRKCYIHPKVLEAFETGQMNVSETTHSGLNKAERLTLALLEATPKTSKASTPVLVKAARNQALPAH